MANITCFVCQLKLQNYTELAQHILGSKDTKHRTPKQIAWASRFINKLPKKDTYVVARPKVTPKSLRPVSDEVYWNSICNLCHKKLKDCCC
jgi:hypothetical protein